jgi:hypothetical protein
VVAVGTFPGCFPTQSRLNEHSGPGDWYDFFHSSVNLTDNRHNVERVTSGLIELEIYYHYSGEENNQEKGLNSFLTWLPEKIGIFPTRTSYWID